MPKTQQWSLSSHFFYVIQTFKSGSTVNFSFLNDGTTGPKVLCCWFTTITLKEWKLGLRPFAFEKKKKLYETKIKTLQKYLLNPKKKEKKIQFLLISSRSFGLCSVKSKTEPFTWFCRREKKSCFALVVRWTDPETAVQTEASIKEKIFDIWLRGFL